MRARLGGFDHGTIVDKQWLEPSIVLSFHVQSKPSAFNAPRSLSCMSTAQMPNLVAYLAGCRFCITVERQGGMGDMTVRSCR